MPGIAENYSLGQLVEIGKIDKELKKNSGGRAKAP